MNLGSAGGFWYDVSDEQLAQFARMSTRERLEWVDAARLFTLRTRTPETAQRQERLRQGLSIVQEAQTPRPTRTPERDRS